MSASPESIAAQSVAASKWRPLSAIERRVLGVLIEKAKTTPENYPLSLNALKAGCNQKSNRAPLMQLDDDQIEQALEELRRAGGVSLVQGGARIDRYRHLAYEWLAVDKVELAVMAELLLRGAQTVGELRGRAARMEPIADLAALRPVLDSLQAKRLIVYLTPQGRGAVVTHALYLDREMEKLRREFAPSPVADSSSDAATASEDNPRDDRNVQRPAAVISPTRRMPGNDSGAAAVFAEELRQLRAEVAAVKQEFQSVRADLEATAADLRRELDELNRQLGN